MKRGTVSASGRFVVPLTLLGANGASESFDALLDTGFSGSVVLPQETAVRLRLRRVGGQRNQVADGRWVWMDAYIAQVVWDGEARKLVVLAAGEVPLVGTSLLHGSRLTADVIDGGNVTIEKLP